MTHETNSGAFITTLGEDDLRIVEDGLRKRFSRFSAKQIGHFLSLS